MPVANSKKRKTSRSSRQGGTFSFASFIGGAVLGGAVVVAVAYPFDNDRSSGNRATETPTIEGPVASDIDWRFIDQLAEAEVKTGVPPAQPPATESKPREYFLSAAQFLREDDAMVMRAELMLDGLPVSISSIPRPRGGAWYRVLVGPYETEAAAQEGLKELGSRGIPGQILAATPKP